MENFFKKYFSLIEKNINEIDIELLNKASLLIKETASKKNKIIICGNGGSAAMASHLTVDLTKVAKIRSINFNEADLLTCFSNDYGFEKVFEKSIEYYGDKNDLLILISSSGRSKNMINAAKKAAKMGIKIVTFTGFSQNNPLKKYGKMNFWVNSNAYNIVEMTHHIWLLAIVDNIIGKIDYKAQ